MAVTAACAITAALGRAAETDPERIVFLGDSITDGFTYPLLVRQALAEAKRPLPTCIDAGVASDTASLMRKRVERDVLVHRPTLVSLSVGINDVNHSVPIAEFEADVRAIAEQLKSHRIPMLLMTTSVLGPKLAEADKRLDEYNAVLRGVAKDYGYPVAEVNNLMRRARSEGKELLEADQVHLSWEGYRVMTRAWLDARGWTDVAVPTEQALEVMPGVVTPWQVRAVDSEMPLEEAQAQALAPDETWKTLALPQSEKQKHWWFEQERRRGFALSLADLTGPGKRWQGYATIDADKPRRAYLNTGAGLQSVWLNGTRVFQADGFTGWHAGKERIPIELQAGRNTLVIESGNEFFLSLTDDNTW